MSDPSNADKPVDLSEKASKADSINTFCYAYCNTEGGKIGGDTADYQVVANRASNHNRESGHSVGVISK